MGYLYSKIIIYSCQLHIKYAKSLISITSYSKLKCIKP